jgi:putative membrane protein
VTTELPRLDELRRVSSRTAVAIVGAVSAVVLAGLVTIVYGHGHARSTSSWLGLLPALNAMLNATSASFLVRGYLAVRRRDFAAHARHLLRALASSALFLASYLVYHSVHGDTRFPGHGIVRPVYFVILVSHIVLSACVVPLILTSFFFSLSGRFAQHRRVARLTLPVWLYVSATGVLVYVFLAAYAGP